MGEKEIQRTFVPGSRWLYYKLYCGTTTANLVLIQTLEPLASNWCEQGLVREWFFIRYRDSDFHLRVRFLVHDPVAIGQIMTQMQHVLHPYLEEELLWKIQLDTYNRELERYGAKTIAMSETLFYHDSVLVVQALACIDQDELKLFFALRVIDQLLTDFGYGTAAKLALVQRYGAGFKQEFHADKSMNKQLDSKYRRYRVALEQILQLQDANPEYEHLLDILNKKSQAIAPIVAALLELHSKERLEVPLDNLLGSYIHMFINRYYSNKQRLHELVCYDFLNRYYRGVLGRERSRD